jgi:hypothetical protein
MCVHVESPHHVSFIANPTNLGVDRILCAVTFSPSARDVVESAASLAEVHEAERTAMIMCAVDLSWRSQAAFTQAIALAKSRGARLTLVFAAKSLFDVYRFTESSQ